MWEYWSVLEIWPSPTIKHFARKFHIMVPKSDWLVSTFPKCIQAYRLSGGEFPELLLSLFVSHNIISGTILLSFDRSFAFASKAWRTDALKASEFDQRVLISVKALAPGILTTHIQGGCNFHALRKIRASVWIVWYKFCDSDSFFHCFKAKVSCFA